jgi:HSP20 family molecular chaperone IbpA
MVTQSTPEAAATPARPEPSLTYQPNVDICDRGGEVLFVADVPGASPAGIDVTFDDGVLSIAASVPARDLPGRVVRREYGIGCYRRSFRIGEGFDAAAISADSPRSTPPPGKCQPGV